MRQKIFFSIIILVLTTFVGCKSHKTNFVNDVPDVKDVTTSTSFLSTQLSNLLDTASILRQMQLSICVFDITANQPLFERGASQRIRPASSQKLVTAIAALDILEPSFCFKTQLLSDGTLTDGILQGNLYVKGGMDPLFSRKDLEKIISILKEKQISRIDGNIYFDISTKDTIPLGWGWCWDDDNPSLSPLLCDGKAQLDSLFLMKLSQEGIAFSKEKVKTLTYHNASYVANLTSLCCIERPLKDVLMPMLKHSDNQCAEALFYQLGYSRKDIERIIFTTLKKADINTKELVIADGSGLSLYNYQTPQSLTKLLTYASRSKQILPLLWETLPIAGIDGTLENRFTSAVATHLRAKTGSVTSVFSLSGYIQPCTNNHLIAFAILTSGSQKGASSRALQDKICELIYSSAPN